ncbi:hypothetical protein CXQ80_18780 [Pseudomonas sp. 02C 26]|nr:hypothetical protein CXQ80_18780 [Pseudomonas sp. 02C 26]
MVAVAVGIVLSGCKYTNSGKAEEALLRLEEFKYLTSEQKLTLEHVRESSKGSYICGTVEAPLYKKQNFSVNTKTGGASTSGSYSGLVKDAKAWYQPTCDEPEPKPANETY